MNPNAPQIAESASTLDAAPGCNRCKNLDDLDFDFTFAYQPIVDFHARAIFAHEALVRGVNNEPAYSILARVNDDNRYRFDQACRVKAVKGAAQLGIQEFLSINFMPNAVYEPAACIRTTFDAARQYHFPKEKIIFEVLEGENVSNRPHLINIFEEYRRYGFQTAIDDFGSGYAGLNLLAEFQPHIVKIDMDLVRDVNLSKPKQAIVEGIVHICKRLGIKVLAEGIETKAERDFFLANGINLMQGYLFCKPAFQAIGKIDPDAWV
ncbi:MAG: EAL domain-containing protein [Gammaproteobacteria bacterium]|uniref:EAL domain-containing protein n=1 Tax=Rhodoferax sp. TaxID=50421 RepID=UPI0017CC3E6B|nr:EAL domain-containing protein [Rhodoferax sp.]MBU3897592.1 EAL domain-containing protein [Gammaproteobacteria bacterium]MBA3059411.1 EAL domain-containing protein [Rhodoferax sp.]MBU3997477.1 EAL domain-containing protein [Gammaproteobacteria bacterium]MBU4017764.1 EAL domain-containing protein [Gammaproteobacteria bacterium]MBU4081207.1 EAL domain-containing protein [Gammaproteobacteria bacterium]